MVSLSRSDEDLLVKAVHGQLTEDDLLLSLCEHGTQRHGNPVLEFKECLLTYPYISGTLGLRVYHIVH